MMATEPNFVVISNSLSFDRIIVIMILNSVLVAVKTRKQGKLKKEDERRLGVGIWTFLSQISTEVFRISLVIKISNI